MTNIRTRLSSARRVLFSDSEYFNKDITGVKSLVQIKDLFSIKGRLIKTVECGNRVEYRLVDSTYDFCLVIID